MKLVTGRLELILQTPAEVLEWVQTLPPDVRGEISDLWLERVRQASEPDPWCCGFTVRDPAAGDSIGSCGFKGPPDEVGAVEIAYGIDEPYRSQGYATESARSLVEFAASVEEVNFILAHTKPDNAACERVLTKLGFRRIGEFDDPDDGPVNRWEFPAGTKEGS